MPLVRHDDSLEGDGPRFEGPTPAWHLELLTSAGRAALDGFRPVRYILSGRAHLNSLEARSVARPGAWASRMTRARRLYDLPGSELNAPTAMVRLYLESAAPPGHTMNSPSEAREQAFFKGS